MMLNLKLDLITLEKGGGICCEVTFDKLKERVYENWPEESPELGL